MHKNRHTIQLMLLSLVASVLTHIVAIYALDWFGSYDLTGPVMMSRTIMVDLAASNKTEPVPPTESRIPQDQHEETAEQTEPASAEKENRESTTGESGQKPEPDRQPAPQAPADQTTNTVNAMPAIPETPKKIRKNTIVEIPPPLRSAAEFMSTELETLSYRITLLGLPVGSGVLEAKQQNGNIKITLRVTSSLVIASVYPVDDLIETRLLSGNYIITKIKQQEGSFRGNRGFTLFLREKSVFWIDLLKQTSTREALPNSEVVDILSGLYYLRNRPLQVGKIETLPIFDSNIYTSIPVEVLRRETISLPGFKNADTLLLHPLIKTEGIFKRAGDIQIWVTDDENHVPVRVETSISLGKVTAELTDSEVKRKGDAEKKE